ncbi:NACHT domain-containing protein [Bacteriovorax sp. PP10]|uniref:NACHT domain-containing protein n=1 Tax=Bacteriovorax antarcticus TaxID=3088717 RepID=A0ABU5VY18_9BACT|nr:NACHT domain-containing protein [Bacteriovorax sp. PP10]MEA9357209.1 NACHT domain-containing protein [Bacteriovorax sp. PP10]
MIEASATLLGLAKGAIAIANIVNSLSSISGIEKNSNESLALINYLKKVMDDTKAIKSLLFNHANINFDSIYLPHQVVKCIDESVNKKEVITYNNFNEQIEIFSLHKNITFIGKAGVGKSTYIQYITRESIKNEFRIPVTIELRKIQKFTDLDVIELVASKINSVVDPKYSITADTCKELCKRGKVLLMLDGVDEIPYDLLSDGFDFINKIKIKYGEMILIITSRPNSNTEILTDFHCFEVMGLTKTQINEFIKNLKLLKYDKELIENLSKTINNTKNKILAEFITTPLYLNLYIMTFKNKTSDVPQKKYKFYQNIVEALMYYHDTNSKNSYNRSLDSKVSKDDLELVLKDFSLIQTLKNEYDFDKKTVKSNFENIKANESLKFDNELLLMDLLRAIPLFVKGQGDVYKFCHRLFQEYFFACKLKEFSSYDDKEQIYNVIFSLKRTRNFEILEFLEEIDRVHFSKYLLSILIDRIKTIKNIIKNKNNLHLFFHENSGFLVYKHKVGKKHEVAFTVMFSSLSASNYIELKNVELRKFERVIYNLIGNEILNKKIEFEKVGKKLKNSKIASDHFEFISHKEFKENISPAFDNNEQLFLALSEYLSTLKKSQENLEKVIYQKNANSLIKNILAKNKS